MIMFCLFNQDQGRDQPVSLLIKFCALCLILHMSARSGSLKKIVAVVINCENVIFYLKT